MYDEVAAFVFSYLIYYSLVVVRGPNTSADLNAWWLKRRGFVQSSVCWGSRGRKFFQGLLFLEKIFEPTEPKVPR
jgi:hypothetical protein